MRTPRWFWPAVGAGIALNGLHLRRRLEHLAVLGPPAGDATGYVVATAAGVVVDPGTARAAAGHARARGLDVLDLVPGDLPVERLVGLLRAVDPEKYPRNVMGAGVTAGQAIVLSEDVVARAGIDRLDGLSAAEMQRLVVTAKRYAPHTTDLVLAPDLHARPVAMEEGWSRLHAAAGDNATTLLALRGLGLLALLTGAVRHRGGRFALLAYHLQPLLVTAGAPVRPPGTALRAGARAAIAVREVAATAAARPAGGGSGDPQEAADRERRRRGYREELADGVERFLEPRRPDCALCGGTDLRIVMRTPDLHQRKPGRFTLERCAGCGHVFQNPRLTIEGLDFYYRDFYDGAGQDMLEAVFSSAERSYRGRVDAVARVTEPRRWLDVGTGHAHFCLLARQRWPKARIDGLDMTESVEEAGRRGWIDTAHRGLFPELAASLAQSYDVVTMHHYLEHTREPAAELDAAAVVLEPGGHLEIEMPNPDSTLGRRLGALWGPYLQPQHLNMVPMDVLERMLTERGFTIVAREVAEAHQPCDFAYAGFLAVNRVLPPGDVPWRPAPPDRRERVTRTAMTAAALPVLGVALAADQVLAPVVARRSSNTYRLVARLDRSAG